MGEVRVDKGMEGWVLNMIWLVDQWWYEYQDEWVQVGKSDVMPENAFLQK